jgi:multiple antibiotic resistance protein
MEWWSVTLILFLIIDPLGKISSLLQVLSGVPKHRQAMIIFREMVIALAIVFFFNVIGETIFNFLGLSEIAVNLSAGIILFLSALRILFPHMRGDQEVKIVKDEPFLIPIAVPMVASPSLVATVMLFAHIEPLLGTMTVAILLSWTAALLILLLSQPLYTLLGRNGLLGIERLMGMILVMLAVQRFLEGVRLFGESVG